MSCTSERTQGDELVFTFGGLIHELDAVFKDRPTPMLVTANSPSLLPWKEALKRLRVKGFVLPEFPPGGSFTAEQADAGVNQERYLVVGVIPCRKSLQTNDPGPLSLFADISNEVFFLRVVTPILGEITDYKLRLYALVDAESSTQLYNAYPVRLGEVYYFHEYRTGAIIAENRRKEWTKKVLEAAVRPSAEPKPPGSLQAASQLSELQEFLEAPTGLLSDYSPPSDDASLVLLEQFLNPMSGTELTLEDAEHLVIEILGLWPDLQRHKITAEKLMLLRRGILESRILVGFSRAYGFLALGCESSFDDPDLGNLVAGFLVTIDKIQRFSAFKTPSLLPNIDAVLKNLSKALGASKGVRNHSADTAQMLAVPSETELFKTFDHDLIDKLSSSDTALQAYQSVREIMLEYGFEAGKEHRAIAGQMQAVIDILQTVRRALAR